ncbi:hypothetical protein RN04_04800 [Arthrobacter sp. W1]|nr:hypothetical protein RN04_04800 [Arthrobacter sp. W1]
MANRAECGRTLIGISSAFRHRPTFFVRTSCPGHMVSFRRLVTFGRYRANFRHDDHPDDHDEEFAFVDLAEDSPVFLPNAPGVPASELLRCWRSRLVSEQGEHDDDPLLTVTQELADLASRVGSVAISAGHKPARRSSSSVVPPPASTIAAS